MKLTDQNIRQCAGSFDLSTFKDEPMVPICDELLEARALLRFLEIHLEVCGDTVLAGKVAIHRTKWDGGEG